MQFYYSRKSVILVGTRVIRVYSASQLPGRTSAHHLSLALQRPFSRFYNSHSSLEVVESILEPVLITLVSF